MPTPTLGLDGKTYLVFGPSENAYKTANLLDVALHCCGGFENAIALDDYIAATQRLLSSLPKSPPL